MCGGVSDSPPNWVQGWAGSGRRRERAALTRKAAPATEPSGGPQLPGPLGPGHRKAPEAPEGGQRPDFQAGVPLTARPRRPIAPQPPGGLRTRQTLPHLPGATRGLGVPGRRTGARPCRSVVDQGAGHTGALRLGDKSTRRILNSAQLLKQIVAQTPAGCGDPAQRSRGVHPDRAGLRVPPRCPVPFWPRP